MHLCTVRLALWCSPSPPLPSLLRAYRHCYRSPHSRPSVSHHNEQMMVHSSGVFRNSRVYCTPWKVHKWDKVLADFLKNHFSFGVRCLLGHSTFWIRYVCFEAFISDYVILPFSLEALLAELFSRVHSKNTSVWSMKMVFRTSTESTMSLGLLYLYYKLELSSGHWEVHQ